jgi:hypothetical protein
MKMRIAILLLAVPVFAGTITQTDNCVAGSTTVSNTSQTTGFDSCSADLSAGEFVPTAMTKASYSLTSGTFAMSASANAGTIFQTTQPVSDPPLLSFATVDMAFTLTTGGPVRPGVEYISIIPGFVNAGGSAQVGNVQAPLYENALLVSGYYQWTLGTPFDVVVHVSAQSAPLGEFFGADGNANVQVQLFEVDSNGQAGAAVTTLQETPEPATLALTFAGLALLSGIGRRIRNR